MRYLLDSHILIWALTESEKLPEKAYNVINAPENEIYYSVASVWEIGIKHDKTPERMPISDEMLVKYCDDSGMLSLPIVKEHALALRTLHRAENTPPHNDPFDRILIAQAKTEGMKLLTHDSLFADYGEPCVETI